MFGDSTYLMIGLHNDSAGDTTTESRQLNSGSGAAADATFTYTHDSEGNLLGDGTSTFEWDLRNRLTAIVTGTHRTEFTYDGSDRRVRVVEKESGTTTSDLRYIYNGLSLLEERASNNSTVLRRFYGSGHVDVANGGTRYAYTTDHLGSIREVMQLDGTSGNPTTATLAARYDYDLWGKRTVLDGGTSAETLVMHGYTGHIRHAWSGLWLAPYRAYNSGLGRWISRDPIGEAGGINLYAYVGNGVLVAIDPLGLWIVISSPNIYYRQQIIDYLEQIKNADPYLRDMVEGLENSDNMHIIEPNYDPYTGSHNQPLNPEAATNRTGTGTVTRLDDMQALDYGPTNVLAHELQHAADADKGIISKSGGDANFPNNAERRAICAENRMRSANGDDLRDNYYDDRPLHMKKIKKITFYL